VALCLAAEVCFVAAGFFFTVGLLEQAVKKPVESRKKLKTIRCCTLIQEPLRQRYLTQIISLFDFILA